MIWWMVATLIAFFVKGLCGFANTLIFTSLLSFTNNNINISPVDLILGYPSNVILAWKERKSIKWSVCLPLAGMVLVGSVPGILFLKNASVTLIKIVLGVVIIIIGSEMLLREIQNKKAKENKLFLIAIGIISGMMCGIFGIGALLGAYVGRVTEDTKAFKGNICFVFTVENTLRLVLYTVWGIITFDVIKQVLLLVPAMFIGLAIGMLSGRVLDEKIVKKLVIIMLIVSGIALILNNIM